MRRRPLVVFFIAASVVLAGALAYRGFDSATWLLDTWSLRPRVLTGGERFETVTVTERAGVRETGEFDGEPGDDLAIVEFDTLRLLTPATLLERQRRELGGGLRSQWKSSFQLARLGEQLLVVD